MVNLNVKYVSPGPHRRRHRPGRPCPARSCGVPRRRVPATHSPTDCLVPSRARWHPISAQWRRWFAADGWRSANSTRW